MFTNLVFDVSCPLVDGLLVLHPPGWQGAHLILLGLVLSGLHRFRLASREVHLGPVTPRVAKQVRQVYRQYRPPASPPHSKIRPTMPNSTMAIPGPHAVINWIIELSGNFPT